MLLQILHPPLSGISPSCLSLSNYNCPEEQLSLDAGIPRCGWRQQS